MLVTLGVMETSWNVRLVAEKVGGYTSPSDPSAHTAADFHDWRVLRRSFTARPIFSTDEPNTDRFKMERFLHAGDLWPYSAHAWGEAFCCLAFCWN